jgi:acyl-CoA thioester hydrolase
MSVAMPDQAARREDFGHFAIIQTRWNDLDSYRHLNNARYYAFFDTAIMGYLQVVGGFDLLNGPTVPFTIENGCRYFRSFTFPDVIEVGLRVARVGHSSVRYELGLFKQDFPELCAAGYFIDVFVDAVTQTPVSVPSDIRSHLERIASASGDPAGTR